MRPRGLRLSSEMIFTPMAVPGAYAIDIEPCRDERGFFARSWCRDEFAARGLHAGLVQCGLSWNPRRGTLRGLHYQDAPHQEAKLVRCTRGAVFDVVVDLRPDSPGFMRWAAAELTDENRRMVYVPPGVAHGFLTRRDDTEVSYQMSEAHHPGSARGVRWDDPAFGIDWPEAPVTIGHRDASYADFSGPWSVPPGGR